MDYLIGLLKKFTNLLVQLSIFLIDLFLGTYRLSSHARLEAFVIQTNINWTTGKFNWTTGKLNGLLNWTAGKFEWTTGNLNGLLKWTTLHANLNELQAT